MREEAGEPEGVHVDALDVTAQRAFHQFVRLRCGTPSGGCDPGRRLQGGARRGIGLAFTVSFDDLDGGEMRRGQLGEAHHQHRRDGEVGRDHHVAAPALRRLGGNRDGNIVRAHGERRGVACRAATAYSQ